MVYKQGVLKDKKYMVLPNSITMPVTEFGDFYNLDETLNKYKFVEYDILGLKNKPP